MLCSEINIPVGHIPSGLFIVSVRDPISQIIDGYLASWVQQVSFDPILIALAVKSGRPAYNLIKSGQVFCINIIGEHDKTFLKHFWKGYDPNQNPFNELPYEIGIHGGVVLNQAKSSLECKFTQSVEPGDHEVFFAKVISSYVINDQAKPLVHIRKSGASY
jgi:flavin reductase (DIM6/NTAB) family NADH-FMN oxidoreductase RutF